MKIAALFALVFSVGCGASASALAATESADAGDGALENSDADGAGDAGRTAEAGADAQLGGAYVVWVTDDGFEPARVDMWIGETVVFRWKSRDPAGLASGKDCDPDLLFQSDPLNVEGAVFVFSPQAPSVVRYFDPLHCDHTGVLVVRTR